MPGPHRATWGERREGLEVDGQDSAPLAFGRALLRSTAKIFVPWQLGHIVAVGAAWGGVERGDAPTFSASFAIYAVIGLYAWTTLRGSGRGVHGLLAGSQVGDGATARR